MKICKCGKKLKVKPLQKYFPGRLLFCAGINCDCGYSYRLTPLFFSPWEAKEQAIVHNMMPHMLDYQYMWT